MLYRLEIENFYSIRMPQVIDLRVAENVFDALGRFDALFPNSKERATKVVAFFGANASGKSTVLRALSFIAWFTQDSFRLAPNASLPCERFNHMEAQKRPIRLAVEFSGPLDRTLKRPDETAAQGTWRYELVIDDKDGRYIVEAEILKQKLNGRGKWVRVFERVGGLVQAGKVFALTGYSMLIDKIRDNASLISTLAQFDHKVSLNLRSAAQSIISNIPFGQSDLSDFNAIRYYAADGSMVEALNQEIQRIDLGVQRMHIQQTPNGLMAYFDHEGLQQPMPWLLESNGTRNFIKNFPFLQTALLNGGVAVIDEIDISIHPLVLPEIVGWFQDLKRNPYGAQLWMTCHTASLLEELEKEEVFFCKKDNQGRTSVYGLQDIQDTHRSDNQYKKYLSGVYGAVPRLG